MAIFLFAFLLSLIFIYLSLGVIKQRGKNKIALGTGSNDELTKWVRAQANFTEYTPWAVLLLLLAEFSGAHKIEIYVVGSLLLLGRVLHAYSMTHHEKYINGILQAKPKFRVIGMQLTFIAILYCAIRLFTLYVIDLVEYF